MVLNTRKRIQMTVLFVVLAFIETVRFLFKDSAKNTFINMSLQTFAYNVANV